MNRIFRWIDSGLQRFKLKRSKGTPEMDIPAARRKLAECEDAARRFAVEAEALRKSLESPDADELGSDARARVLNRIGRLLAIAEAKWKKADRLREIIP